MSRRRRRKLPQEPIELQIDDLSHDGRGVTTWGEKKVFVHGALPGERVMARLCRIAAPSGHRYVRDRTGRIAGAGAMILSVAIIVAGHNISFPQDSLSGKKP